ncbi:MULTISPECIES: 30S ribosome-binding factor RbfA [unclassified Fusibacter]|uniref:30S ribosome-binding factor RbfA n=1 Tax=unclassified Fusibacter TaxID=2624464 RepID=UPI001010CA65|nr:MULTISPECIES: 30S ribosome-binding factor RbfA [unclassified Fusibacter]MCK8058804.1 30S ribosome-binding factor RbfA [Fusibacter sp. A2]NPE21878.1 30S ribosome-binding factor RbfA [Fusibacter sp. A1]RXV61450.1 30S ribosome-binding factor RbfA [Fusibacter sp. A1]
MKFERTLRISEEIKKVVSHLIRFEIKDPRISSLTSITHVETTNDLRFVNIYISVLDGPEKALETIKGLNSAKGFVRKAIGKEVKLRATPEPIFKLDDSIAQSVRMAQLITEVSKGHSDSEDEINDKKQDDSE